MKESVVVNKTDDDDDDAIEVELSIAVMEELSVLGSENCEHIKQPPARRRRQCPVCVGKSLQMILNTGKSIGFVQGAEHWAKGEGKVLDDVEKQALYEHIKQVIADDKPVLDLTEVKIHV